MKTGKKSYSNKKINYEKLVFPLPMTLTHTVHVALSLTSFGSLSQCRLIREAFRNSLHKTQRDPLYMLYPPALPTTQPLIFLLRERPLAGRFFVRLCTLLPDWAVPGGEQPFSKWLWTEGINKRALPEIKPMI